MLKIKPKVLIPIISAILILGLVVFLWTGVWNPYWNPFRLSHMRMLNEAMEKLFTLEIFRAEVDISLEFEKPESKAENLKFSFNFKGDLDFKNKKSASNINFKLEGEESPVSISLGGETRGLGDELYFKIDTLPPFLLFFFLGDIEEIEGKWIKIDRERLKILSKKEEGEATPQTMNELLKEFVDALREHKALKVKDVLASEKIDGVKTFHLVVAFEKEGLKKALIEFLPKLKEYLPEEDRGTFEKELQEALKNLPEKLDNFFKKSGEIEFEVWIGKDKWLRKIKFEKEIDTSQFEEFKDLPEKQIKVRLSLDLRLSNFQKKIEVQAPKDFKPIEEIIPNFYSGSFSLPLGQ